MRCGLRHLVGLLAVPAAVLLASATRVSAQTETTEYYGTDAVGSVRIVFDASGAVLGRQDYDPFGREILAAWGVPPERFGGQSTDGEVQQGYFHARQFQSRTGRFASTDPLFDAIDYPPAWNRYAYALDSPLSIEDSDGLQAKLKTGVNGCVNSPLKKDSKEYERACPAYVGASAPGDENIRSEPIGSLPGTHIGSDRPRRRPRTGDAQIQQVASAVGNQVGTLATPGGLAQTAAAGLELLVGTVVIVDAGPAVYATGGVYLTAWEMQVLPGSTDFALDVIDIESPGPSPVAWGNMWTRGWNATAKVIKFTFGSRTGRR
jgi:RHS repeat-associated protein